ncbi:ribonuclease HII [Amnibacterium kyonggiense]|uniref:Ribonuclease n=1 Tax=Amnibacterium kyonggiense TaxID=595671 RepID=A0A4R7FSW0_9MICO|nr:ribonuclease HII [Amnibacterium kyonggiense]TDS80961.1 RNase HII [Amnibacterium kyonggiense]
MTASRPPGLRVERALLDAGATVVIGCDEVGRGAIAGPVGVGVAVLDPERRRIPTGLRDSKLLPEPERVAMEPRVRAWAAATAVGLAGNDEIDGQGISRSLGTAGARAIGGLVALGVGLGGAVVLLDGNWDWLTPGLIAAGLPVLPQVVTRIKADRDCAAVSAASVVAKVHRDALMIDRHAAHPVYGWRSNKGYASRSHYAAIDEHGPCDWHRRTWLHALPEAAAESADET